MSKCYFVYILASGRNGTLYVGVTNDLLRRTWEHKSGVTPGFASRYGVTHLVYFELHESVEAAIHRETRLKKWKRRWKLELIEKHNPGWSDLYDTMTAPKPLPEWLVNPQGNGDSDAG